MIMSFVLKNLFIGYSINLIIVFKKIIIQRNVQGELHNRNFYALNLKESVIFQIFYNNNLIH